MGQYTNHSRKVTCATTLFKENTDEQLIKRQTGHRSDAVHAYKYPCSSHNVAVSDAQQPPSKQLATNLESDVVSVPLKTKARGMPMFNFNISFNMRKD